MRKYHDANYVPGNAILVIFGDHHGAGKSIGREALV